MINIRSKKLGFTLVELLVVISIISLLSSIVLSAVNDAREKAGLTAIKDSAIQLRNAIELYKLENGDYPSLPQTLPASASSYPSANYTNARLLDSDFIENELGKYLHDWYFPEQYMELFISGTPGDPHSAIYYATSKNWPTWASGSPGYPNCGSGSSSETLEYVVYFRPKKQSDALGKFPVLYLNNNNLGDIYFCLFSPIK